jgi:transposase
MAVGQVVARTAAEAVTTTKFATRSRFAPSLLPRSPRRWRRTAGIGAITSTVLPTRSTNAGMLARLKGIGPDTAGVLWSEGLLRQFDNRRQVAAYAGLAPTP